MDPYDLIRNPLGVISGGNGGNSPSGGGAVVYYKCASVDAANGTWVGNLAIIDGETGVWSFAETVTPDRPINKIIPQVGKVYDENCTFMVSGFDIGEIIPSNGLVFYAPLATDFKDTVHGYDANEKAGTFTEYNGKKMLYSDGSNGIVAKWNGQSNSFLPKGTAPCSIFAMRMVQEAGDNILYGFGDFWDRLFCEKLSWDGFYAKAPSAIQYRQDNGYNILNSVCITRDVSGNVVIYEGGTVKVTGTDTASYGNSEIVVGISDGGNFHGYISDFAIYDRVLSAKEVLSMHNNLML